MTDVMLHNFGFRTAYDTGVFSPDYRESTDDAQKYAEIFADCINAPKYGNADPYADQLLRDYHMYLLHYLPTLESFLANRNISARFPFPPMDLRASSHWQQPMVA